MPFVWAPGELMETGVPGEPGFGLSGAEAT
jgi:hypothetical protein